MSEPVKIIKKQTSGNGRATYSVLWSDNKTTLETSKRLENYIDLIQEFEHPNEKEVEDDEEEEEEEYRPVKKNKIDYELERHKPAKKSKTVKSLHWNHCFKCNSTASNDMLKCSSCSLSVHSTCLSLKKKSTFTCKECSLQGIECKYCNSCLVQDPVAFDGSIF